MTPCFAATGAGCMDVFLRAMETQSPGQRDNAVDDLVHHAVLAEAWPEAARYALAAGERASRRSALTEAKAYLETAIAALSQQPASVATMTQGIDARLSLRGVLATMNDTSGIQEYLKEADNLAELAGDRLNLARVYISSRHHAVPLGRPARRHRAEPARHWISCCAGNDSVGIVGAAFSLAQALWYSGDLDEARHVLVSKISHARGEGGQRRSAATFVSPSVVFFCQLTRICGDLGDSVAGFAAIKEARHA